jgi:hypothetical protein
VKQKYVITRNDDKNELVIQEFGELDKDIYSLLCEELYDSKNIQTAIKGGDTTLISTIRTENLFPIGIYAQRIAEAIISLYESQDDPSVELFFNDTDLVARGQKTRLDIDESDNDSDDINDLLEDDVDGPDFDEKDDIGKISYPLKVTDDDSGDIDDDNE